MLLEVAVIGFAAVAIGTDVDEGCAACGLLEMMKDDWDDDKEDMERLEMFDEDSEQDVDVDEEVEDVDDNEDVAKWS